MHAQESTGPDPETNAHRRLWRELVDVAVVGADDDAVQVGRVVQRPAVGWLVGKLGSRSVGWALGV